MTVPRKSVDAFLSQKKLAVMGVSRDTKQFANSIYRLLKERNYTVYPVNPNAEYAENDRCFRDIKSLPEQVGGVLVLLPPEKIFQAVSDITEAGIKHIWLNNQAESKKTLQYCRDHNVNIVYGQCVLMFLEPLAFPHRLHRWINKVTGKFPVEA